MSESETRRVFIGGVGYPFLRDFSVGPVLVPELRKLDWPAGVEIDDLNVGGPIAAVHRFQEEAPYERVIIFGSVRRERVVGQLYAYLWDGELPDPEDIQARVSEAVTGVISLDNLLIIGGYFKIWPPQVIVIELEPRDEAWGEAFSEPVQAALPRIVATIRQLSVAPLDGLTRDPFVSWEGNF